MIWKIAYELKGVEMICGIFKSRKEAVGSIDGFKKAHPTAENVTVIAWKRCG